MDHPTRNHANLLILLVVTLGLVFLGMKLPDLQELATSPLKPKPRPRAVVKTQIKTCAESIKKIQPAYSSDHPVRDTLPTVSVLATPLGSDLPVTAFPTPIVGRHLSRAPPAHS